MHAAIEPDYIAQCAQLAMLLEVSATPKPGNIDREHNYKDTKFEHFLASAVGVYPVLERAAGSKSGIGSLIHEAVIESSRWQQGGNTHFGGFLLLIPLIIAAGSCENNLKVQVQKVVRETTVEDAVEFYRAFSKAKVKVKPVNDLDLGNSASIHKIKERGLTLFNLMEISCGYDMLAEEWVYGFQKSFECAGSIQNKIKKHSLNDAVVLTFMELLSKYRDTFIQTKFDRKKAEEVSVRAKEVLGKKDMHAIRAFDEELLSAGINPGSIADIIIAGLFVALVSNRIKLWSI